MNAFAKNTVIIACLAVVCVLFVATDYPVSINADKARGQLFIDVDTGDQDIAAQDTYYIITNMTPVLLSSMTATHSNLTVGLRGTYKCSVNVSFNGSIGDVYEGAVFTNGVEAGNVEMQRKTSNNDTGSMGGCGLLDLQSSDFRA